MNIRVQPRQSPNILCIDPGSNLGWAVFNREDKTLVSYGQISTRPKMERYDRLHLIQGEVEGIFNQYEPSLVVIEDVARCLVGLKSSDAIFWLVSTFVVVTMTAYKERAEIHFIAPKELKRVLTGNGNAKKDDVVEVINAKFGLSLLPSSGHNKSDAIGLGVVELEL